MCRGETRFHLTTVFPCKSGDDDDDPPAVTRAAHKVLPMPNNHLCSHGAHGSTARSALIETTELRWFRNGPFPRSVCSWFTSNGAFGAVEERHDRYLMDGRLDRGLKLRDGSTLELKVRQPTARTVPSGDGPDAVAELPRGTVEESLKQGFRTKREAEAALAEGQRTVLDGPVVAHSNMRLDELLDEWLIGQEARLRPSSHHSYVMAGGAARLKEHADRLQELIASVGTEMERGSGVLAFAVASLTGPTTVTDRLRVNSPTAW